MSAPWKEPRLASLLDMPCGRKLRVEELTGSPSVRSRLYSMGILPGTEMEVCRPSDGSSCLCVRVRQSSLVLDETMAGSIMCRPADDNDCRHSVHHRHRRNCLHHEHLHGRPLHCANIDHEENESRSGVNEPAPENGHSPAALPGREHGNLIRGHSN